MVRKAKIFGLLVFSGLALLQALTLFGCAMFGEPAQPFRTVASEWTATSPMPDPSSALGLLNWTAGISILGGMVALVLTAGRLGLRAIIGGVLLVILSYVISVYMSLVLVPAGIVLTIVSAGWAYKIIVKAWRMR